MKSKLDEKMNKVNEAFKALEARFNALTETSTPTPTDFVAAFQAGYMSAYTDRGLNSCYYNREDLRAEWLRGYMYFLESKDNG